MCISTATCEVRFFVCFRLCFVNAFCGQLIIEARQRQAKVERLKSRRNCLAAFLLPRRAACNRRLLASRDTRRKSATQEAPICTSRLGLASRQKRRENEAKSAQFVRPILDTPSGILIFVVAIFIRSPECKYVAH